MSRKVRDRNTLTTAFKDFVTGSRVWEDFWKDGLRKGLFVLNPW